MYSYTVKANLMLICIKLSEMLQSFIVNIHEISRYLK